MALGKYASVRFTCSKCGGIKTVGEDYYALGEMWVDITCIKCSDSKDISIVELDSLLTKLKKAKQRRKQIVNNKTDSK